MRRQVILFYDAVTVDGIVVTEWFDQSGNGRTFVSTPIPPSPVILFCVDCGSEGGRVRYAEDPPRCDQCHLYHLYSLLKTREHS